ncbi:cholest-4-en-3-one 26-monooxygenase [Lentzea albidocapillata subsp. violacea]|uniref:Cholest-4-en-3-one 26-monooxygenase n=1 Tax=Lentzea albidocapillata subsp. violacea TaxID=128104 RepID=A0A1G8R4I4_9PSEU|nr:cytochrome P450 [Lentzea albidocapillata]SDJ11838.1 cholest-4-en-3-one 26-monooxygenase [Lentzea albidocapillata subsp. violacea]
MGKPRIPDGFDFTDPDMYANRLPFEEFAELRQTAPIWWNSKPLGEGGFPDEGFWVVTKHRDVKEISRNSELFSSRENTAIIRFKDDMPRDNIEMQRLLLLNMDPPTHTKQRAIVSRGFTPRAVNSLREALASRAERIVAEALEKGSGDFVTDVACELPLQAIAELIGIPQDDRRKIFDWSNQMIAYDDPEFEIEPLTAATELLGYSWTMAEDRRKCPRQDIVTKLVQADVDGAGLASEEFGFFVLLLAVAGNETTRNAITHGMKAFFDHPEQWELYKDSRPATAGDEIVRWATPVVSFQRTAMADTELGGVEIKQGQRVGMFYSSANFDEEVFESPEMFDITRDPNPHLGFGGSGAHFCIGANLARLEIDLIFNAIADAMPNIRQIEEPRRLRSGWLNGIKEFRVQYA